MPNAHLHRHERVSEQIYRGARARAGAMKTTKIEDDGDGVLFLFGGGPTAAVSVYARASGWLPERRGHISCDMCAKMCLYTHEHKLLRMQIKNKSTRLIAPKRTN